MTDDTPEAPRPSDAGLIAAIVAVLLAMTWLGSGLWGGLRGIYRVVSLGSDYEQAAFAAELGGLSSSYALALTALSGVVIVALLLRVVLGLASSLAVFLGAARLFSKGSPTLLARGIDASALHTVVFGLLWPVLDVLIAIGVGMVWNLLLDRPLTEVDAFDTVPFLVTRGPQVVLSLALAGVALALWFGCALALRKRVSSKKDQPVSITPLAE